MRRGRRYFAVSQTAYLTAVGALCLFNVLANMLLWVVFCDQRRKAASYAFLKANDEGAAHPDPQGPPHGDRGGTPAVAPSALVLRSSSIGALWPTSTSQCLLAQRVVFGCAELRRPNYLCRRHSASPSRRKSRSHLLPPPCPPRAVSCGKFRDLPSRAMSAPVAPQSEGPSTAAEVQALFSRSNEPVADRQAAGPLSDIDRADSMAWILDDRSPERLPKRRLSDSCG